MDQRGIGRLTTLIGGNHGQPFQSGLLDQSAPD